jgi:biotin operon repressor
MGPEAVEQKALLLLCGGRLSCDGLAGALGVSRPTAARLVARLRRRGVRIVSLRENGSWSYEVRNRRGLAARQWRRLRRCVGMIRRPRPEPMKQEDRLIYGV